MALAGLGRTPEDCLGDHELIRRIAAFFSPAIKDARDRLEVQGLGLEGLRLPDFLELAAIAEKLGDRKPTEQNVKAAQVKAWPAIKSIGLLAMLAGPSAPPATCATSR